MDPLVLPITGLILSVAQIIYGDTPQSQGSGPHLTGGEHCRQPVFSIFFALEVLIPQTSDAELGVNA